MFLKTVHSQKFGPVGLDLAYKSCLALSIENRNKSFTVDGRHRRSSNLFSAGRRRPERICRKNRSKSVSVAGRGRKRTGEDGRGLDYRAAVKSRTRKSILERNAKRLDARRSVDLIAWHAQNRIINAEARACSSEHNVIIIRVSRRETARKPAVVVRPVRVTRAAEMAVGIA